LEKKGNPCDFVELAAKNQPLLKTLAAVDRGCKERQLCMGD